MWSTSKKAPNSKNLPFFMAIVTPLNPSSKESWVSETKRVNNSSMIYVYCLEPIPLSTPISARSLLKVGSFRRLKLKAFYFWKKAFSIDWDLNWLDWLMPLGILNTWLGPNLLMEIRMKTIWTRPESVRLMKKSKSQHLLLKRSRTICITQGFDLHLHKYFDVFEFIRKEKIFCLFDLNKLIKPLIIL